MANFVKPIKRIDIPQQHTLKILEKRPLPTIYLGKTTLGHIVHNNMHTFQIPEKYKRSLNTIETGNITFCLDYLRQLTALADRYTVEPTTPFGYVVDLELRHHHGKTPVFYAIEVKTLWKKTSGNKAKKGMAHGKRQVRHHLDHLARTYGQNVKRMGYVLLFVLYDDGSPPQALWYEVLPNIENPA